VTAPFDGTGGPAEGLVAPHLGLLELDDRLVVRAVDPGFEAMFGVVAAAVVGQPFDALLSVRDRRGARLFHERLSLGSVRRVDLPLTLQVGGREAITRLVMWRRGAGWGACVEEIAGEGNLIHDLTEARDRWVQIVKQSVEGVGVLDELGRLTEFNAAFFQLLDLRSARGVSLTEDALRGAPLAELLVEESLAPIVACVRAAEQGTLRALEVQHRGRWLEVAARPLSLPRRRFAGVCVQVRDVTARRQGELLKLQKEAAEAASAAKSMFLASMSHELRTPLNAIIGYCELLLEEARERQDQGLADDLQRIGLSARHLLDLVRNVLDLSAIEAGRMLLHPEAIELAPLLGQVRAALQPLAEQQGSAIGLACADDVGVLEVDVVRLRQVLINLVGNAVKFTRDGTITLSAARVRRAGQTRVEIAVADTGIGIPQQRLDELFQEFARVGSPTSKVEGAGLGLVVSRRLIELMGGEIQVRSEVDRGSVFTIHLPLQLPGRGDARP
jgi:PAS domain S-box-containing protein